MSFALIVWPVRLVASGLLLLAFLQSASAQSIVVMVNDEPVTSYDVAQRQRFLALTSGLGDKMRERMKSEETKEAFKAFMIENRPQSKEEAQELQKKFVAQLQQQVLASSGKNLRQEAVDQLINEKLMLQAAKERKITVPDEDVNQALTRMAEGGSEKRTLQEFLASFTAQGVNPSTLKERIRAQIAWRDLIRGLYGPLVASTVAPTASAPPKEEAAATVDIVDAEVVTFSVSGKGNQKALAARLVDADQLRKGFASCAKLRDQVKDLKGVSVKSVKAVKVSDFAGESRTALASAKAGDMTPPAINGGKVETVAVCAKKTVADTTAKAKPGEKDKDKGKAKEADERQDKLSLYAQRHLKDMRARALLKYPNNG
jgi:peptidyl-prolyl cis-trans isomerase SurA